MLTPIAITARRSRFTILSAAIVALALAALAGPASALASPALTVTAGPTPGSTTSAKDVTFSLSATTAATKDVDFYCSMDSEVVNVPCDLVNYPTCATNGAAQTCTQSKTYLFIAPGNHVFRAFETECDSPCDTAVNGVDGPLTTVAFTVDRTAPTLTISGGPSVAAPVLNAGASFTFAANEASSFTCALDGGYPTVCTSPFALGVLSNGSHELKITARDAAGNTSAPLAVPFAVDIFKPKKCKKAKSKKGKAKFAKCKKANVVAKTKWKHKHGL